MGKYTKKADIIIKNGIVTDGSGTPSYYADVAICGDKIDYIGNLKDTSASLIIDAEGKYVTPGFIDSHTHSDQTIWANPECQSAVRQGVTTEIVGNCGFSMRNGLTHFDEKGKSVKCVYDMVGKKDIPKGAMAAVIEKAETMGASLNTAWFCGHNDLRVIAGISAEEYTKEQFRKMADFLTEALEAGFIGLSTGLEFDPGIMSRPEEVERLAEIVACYDGHYSSHIRDEGTYLFEAIEEFLNVVRKTGVRGTLSHLNVKYDNGIPNEYLYKGMQMLKDARENEHLNVYADMLPTCFATGTAQAMLPPWLYKDGWDEAKKILKTTEGRENVKKDMNRYWRFLFNGQWDRLLGIKAYYLPETLKLSFEELVKKWNKPPVDCFLDVFLAAPTIEDARSVTMQGTVFYEQTMIDSVVKDPIYLWMTDSSVALEVGELALDNMQHYMSMTHFFARYVRELKAISFEEAVCKATYRPATHYKLKNRGLIKEGFFADINVFDLDNLKINATFSEPCKYSEGMDYVIVNGVPVIEKGEHSGKRVGRVLKNI